MKNIIINADDFGLSKSVNAGILEAYSKGLVSSISLMACGSATDDAIQIIRDNQIADIGIHLVLDQEKPILAAQQIPDLVNRNGYFQERSKLLLKTCFMNKKVRNQIKSELSSQIEKVLDSGITPTHIDGHGHVHLYPGIIDIVIELSRKYKIFKSRLSYEPLREISLASLSFQTMKKLIVNVFSAMAREKLILNNIRFPDRFYGTSCGGDLTYCDIASFMQAAPDQGVTEIMSHPGFISNDLRERYYSWGYKWESELETLLSKNKADFPNIRFVSFGNLAQSL